MLTPLPPFLSRTLRWFPCSGTWRYFYILFYFLYFFMVCGKEPHAYPPPTLSQQNLEVVPLFGDMQIAPFNYIKRSKNFDAKLWPLCSATAISPQASLMCHLPRIREEHIKYISDLARYSNEVRLRYIYNITSVPVPSKMMASKKKRLIFYCPFYIFYSHFNS